MISSNFYEYIDRESIDSDLICLLCHNPFIDPTVTQCGDTYCRPCIEKDMGNGSHCPSQSCNQLLSTDHLIPPSRRFISMLDKLKVRCQLCEKTNINRGIFDEHVKTSCFEYRIDCPGKNIGCQWFGSRKEHDEHTKTCLFEKLRPIVDILYKDIEKLQKQTEQQTTELGQHKTDIELQKTQIEQLEAQLQQQQIPISDIQSENQTQNNEITSIRNQITILQEE
ncbi:unnamed protein product, partial [Rotaria socialis]